MPGSKEYSEDACSCRKKALQNFCKKMKLNFVDFSTLECAFTHGSRTKGQDGHIQSYERLEFLGDAVLKTAISEFLFKKFPEASEGELTQYRAYIVSDVVLSDLASKIGLEDLILLANVKLQSSILACAFEAVLGAIFLEFGLDVASDFLLKNFGEEFSRLIAESEFSNPKALLQEYTQGLNGELPSYVVVDEHGVAHDKTFEVAVYYCGEVLGKGTGKSKKEAQQRAAKEALIKLGVIK